MSLSEPAGGRCLRVFCMLFQAKKFNQFEYKGSDGYDKKERYFWLYQGKDVSSTPARITAVHKERYELICEYGYIYGRLKTSIYFEKGCESFPTVGDFVLVNYNPSGDSQIIKTLERKSFFSRRDPALGRGEQAVAAKFEYVFIM